MTLSDKVLKNLESLVASRTEMVLGGKLPELDYRTLTGEIKAFQTVINHLKQLEADYLNE